MVKFTFNYHWCWKHVLHSFTLASGSVENMEADINRVDEFIKELVKNYRCKQEFYAFAKEDGANSTNGRMWYVCSEEDFIMLTLTYPSVALRE